MRRVIFFFSRPVSCCASVSARINREGVAIVTLSQLRHIKASLGVASDSALFARNIKGEEVHFAIIGK